jgi:hypothetical protein
MIMATKLLNQRIKDVICARTKAGNADIIPTLVDIERTHILYVNAHFKPFAAIGYEYNKVTASNGTNSLGSGIQFSIPQFGDFFHDMVCRLRMSQVQANTGTTPTQGQSSLYPVDTATEVYTLVDIAGNNIGDGVSYSNLVRYCEYPGNRLFRLVKFDVNGNPLDQYDQMIPTMIEKFCTLPHKRTGHDRLVGQEVPVIGYRPVTAATVRDPDASTPASISKFTKGQSNQTVGLFNANTVATGAAGAALSSSANRFDINREVMQVVNGPQTPKPIQPPLEVWNKLRFWFNEDVRLSIPSVSIPYGQRFITIELASQSDIVYESPSIFVKRVADVTVSGKTTRTVSYTPYFTANGIADVSIENIELYINNIFVNPEIHDIYIKRIGFSLIRVYRQHTQTCSQTASEEKLLSQLKWPVEYMFIGLRPRWNTTNTTNNSGTAAGTVTGNQYVWRDWHRLTKVVNAVQNSAISVDISATAGAVTNNIMSSEYYLPVPTVDSLSLTSHGITIFDSFNDTFFNQYMPFHYGGTALTTPDDVGALFVNMALFPRSYQPSGHLNISRARETYLKWTTSYISPSTSADLLCVAIAINFLLISDGSCVLRYST